MLRRCRPLALAAAGLAPLLATCGGEETGPRDVLLVTLDTLRADFLGCYGSPFGLTPVLDELALRGALFERHYTSAVYTGPAHATLLTGLAPEEHGVWRNGLRLPADVPRLSEAFAAAGYRTAAVIGSAVLGSKFGYDQGFEVFDEELARGPNSPRAKIQYQRTAEEVVARAAEILAEEDQRPLFLWIHLYDVHGPFTHPVPAALAEAELEHLLPQLALPAASGDEAPTPTRAAALELTRGYGAAVAYTDREVGALLAAFEAARGPHGVVAITSDHGEGLWEHGYDGHGLLLYEEAVQVPLVLLAPGRLTEGARVRGVTSSADLPSTLLLLAGAGHAAAQSGLPLGAGLMERLSAPGEAGGEAFQHRHGFRKDPDKLKEERAILTELGTGPDEEIALVRGRWKAIGPPYGDLRLYDLEADPAETVNLAAEEPAVLAELRARMLERDAALSRSEDGQALGDEATRRMLDDLGY
jgi:choline-sulfatase